MATIRKRGDKWQAQVRKKGARPATKSFYNRRDAEAWARQEETAIDLGRPRTGSLHGQTLGELLLRYQQEITPAKKGAAAEDRRLKRLRSDPIANTSLSALDAQTLSAFRDRRIKDGARACQYDLVIIRHAIEIGRKEWGLNFASNPVSDIRVPNGIKSRSRRLTADEYQRLERASLSTRNRLTWLTVRLAIQTAMRRSELLALKWENVDLDAGLASLPDSKNGKQRSVPLTLEAINILKSLPRRTEKVLPISECALRQSWERLVSRAKISDLHFHDLRHEAVSRFFEMGLSVPEVALISGHRDPRMLFRYTHLRASQVAEKLAAAA